MKEARELINKYDIKCHPKARDILLDTIGTHNNLCNSATVCEFVYDFLRALNYDPVMSTWREEIDLVPFLVCMPEPDECPMDLAIFNLERAQYISRRRRAAIVIQDAVRKHINKT
jgi:hypothetical protein